jgi:predicted transcriptional regulator
VDSESSPVALLAIQPRFAQAIIAGEKTVEFRKTRFSQRPRFIVLYASTPIQQIVAFFEVEDIYELTPLGLWRKFHKAGGIDYKEFAQYYRRSDRGYAIVVGAVWALRRPASLKHLIPRGSAPQSFRYLRADSIRRLLERHT